MDIAAWLQDLGLERYAPAFRDNDIDAAILLSLTGGDLEKLGVTSVGHRRKLLDAIAALRTAPASTPTSATATAAAHPRADIPRHLADKILQSKSALEGERKQVTVLFVDVKGSMDLAEQLGPEEWHTILERFFQLLAGGVHRFEGTVNQYTGDGIMALFGAPIAHEDHAQRACHAALYLREALRAYADDLRRTRGLSFSTRMGLNSGDVVVGKIGDDLQMDYTALGHTVGLAQRMEQLAEPGAVCLTPHTARLVEGYFTLRSLGVLAIKGSHETLEVSVLEGPGRARTHFELARARGLSKFVGRDAELVTLEAALERSNAGNGQIVGIVAVAGAGKSRLCYEFLERCRARGFVVYECRGVAHGARIPLLPMLELFRRFFEIEDGDTESAAREKIAGRLLLLDESLRDDLPIFFDMLGVPDSERPLPPTDPEVLQRRAYAATRAIVRAEGERPLPAILLVEDLQWLDSASDAFVAEMIEAQATCRGLIVVNFRPGYKAEWMSSSSYQQLPLVPLGQDAVHELLADLLGSDGSVAELVGPIYQRAGGNPFFVEEIVQNLVETGVLEGRKGGYRLRGSATPLTLPETVQAVLAARIDRLHAREKRLLQQAAVIGKTVPERILKRIANLADTDYQPAMRSLREADLLCEESLYPQVAYAFKHPLTHEVAYRTQLKDRRAQTHASVARVIEELGEDRLDEEAALIAHHWEEAGEKTMAARWHARAARWIGIRDYAEAFAHWRRVSELTDDDGAPDDLALRAEAFRMLPVLAYRTETSDEEEAAFFEQGRRFLERIGDERSLAAFTVAHAGLRENACDLKGYEQATREACRIAERCGELALRAAVRPDRLWSLYRLGQLREAIAIVEEIAVMTGGDVELGADICGFSPYFMSHMLGSAVLVDLGRLREARERAERGVQIALVRGPDESLCWAHYCQTMVFDGAGKCGSALTGAARLALEAAERSGSPQALVVAQGAIVVAAKSDGDWLAAIAAAETALRVSRSKRAARDFELRFLGDYAEALLGAGEIERAVEVATEAAELAQARGALVHRCHSLVVLARCVRERNGISASGRISGLLDEVDRLVDETGAAYWRPRALVERAELDRLRGNPESARSALVLAQRLFAEMGATGYAVRIGKGLAP